MIFLTLDNGKRIAIRRDAIVSFREVIFHHANGTVEKSTKIIYTHNGVSAGCTCIDDFEVIAALVLGYTPWEIAPAFKVGDPFSVDIVKKKK